MNTSPVIVGIGASAGGIKTLQSFLEFLPDGLDAAFVVIVHLSPVHESDLAGILATKTTMPVIQVQAPVPLEAGHVYVIPPNQQLEITDHQIAALAFEEPRGQRAPIDLFFRSLAKAHGDSFAIILTGAGSDGTLGLRAVKEAGGIILVQDPREAEYPSMPQSAIATGVVDFVLPLRELVSRLAELVQNKKRSSSVQLGEGEEDLVKRIVGYLRARTGHDFSQYKQGTVLRRLSRRMHVTRRDNLSDYFAYLRGNVEEVQALFGDLLISVTMFFRDPQAFDVLATMVIPQLFSGRDMSDGIRIWVPGCATGEEAYTLGILLLEEAARHHERPLIQIFASDLDPGGLAVAREGLYPVTIEATVRDDRLQRYFWKEQNHYRVKRELRDIILFATHSVLKDPPFSRLDLISCRNLMIYLDREVQQQICSIFRYALQPNGFLFLGLSETAESPPGLFRSVDRDAHLYQSTGRAGDKHLVLPRMTGNDLAALQPLPGPGRGIPRGRMLHQVALEAGAPPSIIVDEAYQVIHLSETAGRYMQPSAGRLSAAITDLIRPELRLDLRCALHDAFERGAVSLSLPILVRFNGDPHRVYLQVKPIAQDGKEHAHEALVFFIEGGPIEVPPEVSAVSAEGAPSKETIDRIKAELQNARAQLHTTREESEDTNEALRAANEELQSINEEYRSTCEELETSREELQSINEELQTFNNEMKMKLQGLSRANDDLQNLMAATEIGTLFLDAALRIKLFTPRITDLFNIQPSDAGRPLSDLSHQLDYPDLLSDARAVIAQLVPIEREARDHSQRWHLIRFRPYRTTDDRIDGVVITFVDVTEWRRAEEALKQSEELLRQRTHLIEISREPIFVWDFDSGIVEWNLGCEKLYGYTRQEALAQPRDALLQTTVPGSSLERFKQELFEAGSWSGEFNQKAKDGRELTVESRIELVTFGDARLVLENTRDVSQRKFGERSQ